MKASEYAIYAARNVRNWGMYAARRYAAKRGVLRLFTLAYQLQVTQEVVK